MALKVLSSLVDSTHMTTQSSRHNHSMWQTSGYQRAFLIIATCFAVTMGSTVAGADSGIQVAQDQQAMLVQLNAARWDPAGFGEAFEVDLEDMLARPPLAVNPSLTDSAAFKANEIALNGYFSHQSPVTGVWPNELATDGVSPSVRVSR